MRAAVSARSSASSMSMRPPQYSANSWWPMTRPSPQMAAWSTATQFGSGCGLRVGGDQVEAGRDGVVLGERLDETQDGEDAQLMVRVGVTGCSAMSSGQQLTMPARSPSRRGASNSRASVRAAWVHRVPAVGLGQRVDGPVCDRADAVAAAAQFVGDGCRRRPRRRRGRARTIRPALTRRAGRRSCRRLRAPTGSRSRPLSMRSGDMRDEALSDCTVKPSKTASGSPTRSVIVMSLSICFAGRRHDAHVDRHVFFGRTVDGAVPDPGRQVRVFVAPPARETVRRRVFGRRRR